MMTFLTAEKPDTSPFPMFATMQNVHLYDSWDALARHHVYRSPWDRKLPDTPATESALQERPSLSSNTKHV